MGKNIIYLIKANSSERYKIGITTKKNITNRLRNLQTGSADQLNIIKTYESELASLIEKTLHREFGTKKVMGEWFELDINDVLIFEQRCKNIESNIYLLKNQNNSYILNILK